MDFSRGLVFSTGELVNTHVVYFKESQAVYGTLPKQYTGEDRSFQQKHSSSDKPIIVDASQLFKQSHRATRPDHFVIILRGLPGISSV